MSDVDLNNFDTAIARATLVARLEAFRHRLRWHLGVAGATRVALLTTCLILASFVIDRTFRLGLPIRLTLLAGGLIAIAYEAWRSLAMPLRQRMDFVPLVDATDRAGGNAALASRVATVLELENHAADATPPSAAMVRAAVHDASRSLEGINWLDRLDAGRLRGQWVTLSATLGGLLLIAVIFHHSSGLWLRRWLAGSNAPWPQKTYLLVNGLSEDGRLLVPRGEAATVLVRVRDGSQEPKEVNLTLRPAAGKRIDSVMTRFAAGDFRQDLLPVTASETIEVYGGDEELDPIQVEPIDRPRIEKLELISQHPLDPKPITHDFGGDSADLTFLPQTALRLRIYVSAPLEHLAFGEKDVAVTTVDDKTYDLTWKQTRAMNFQIELTAAGTKLTSITTPLTIGLLIDQPPRVTLAFTGVRQRITPQASIPLTIDARDDYGIHDATVAARAEWLDANQQRQAKATTQPVFGPQHPAEEKDIQLSQTFTVGDLHLPVGSLLAITAAVNDERYEGPQTGKSKEATFRLVSPEELFREILLRQQGERAKFRKEADEAVALRTDLASITNDTAAALSRRHRTLQREVERIATSLGTSLTELKLNALGTAESYDLMQHSVLEPLKELTTGLMTQQRDALDAAAAGPIDSAAITDRQGKIADQMNAILKQMAQWDSFVDVLNQLNEIIRLQEQAKQTTDRLHQADNESVFDK